MKKRPTFASLFKKCSRPDLNWHRDCSRLDFKSNASTDSATGACIIAYRLQRNNTTNIFHCQIENLVIYLSNSLILTVKSEINAFKEFATVSLLEQLARPSKLDFTFANNNFWKHTIAS